MDGLCRVASLRTCQRQSAAQSDTSLGRGDITGSATKRIDAETAVPVTVIKADDLKKQGLPTVEQVMTQLSAVTTKRR